MLARRSPAPPSERRRGEASPPTIGRIPYDRLVAAARAQGRSLPVGSIPAVRVPLGSIPSRLVATIATIGSTESVRSYRSRASVLSNRSAGSIMSSWSVLSAGSLLSFGSVGSILSIGSAGSILSIGSSGSILSIGASGGFLSMGRAGDDEGLDAKAGEDQIPTRPRLIS